jgi:hypothetical protein
MIHPSLSIRATIVALLALVLSAPFVLAHDDHDHAHQHGTVEAPAGMTVSLGVSADPMSGYNVHIVTTGFAWAPERASLDHVAGEGHAHLYVNGEKVARVYGPWYHLDALPSAAAEVRVTLNTNTHDDYARDGVVVADSVTVTAGDASEGAHDGHAGASDEHDHRHEHDDDHDHEHDHDHHDDHDHDHDDEHDHDHDHDHGGASVGPIGANVVATGDVDMRIEPVLANDGRLVFALTALSGGERVRTDLSGTVVTPDGATVAFQGGSGVALAPAATATQGRYRIEGRVGSTSFAADVAALVGTTAFGTDVVAFLAPAPGPAIGRAELFAYGLAGGTAVHAHYTAGVAPGADGSAAPVPAAELTHTHFDHVDGLSFSPAGNQAGLAFPGAGPWNLAIELGGGVDESVAFTVAGD